MGVNKLEFLNKLEKLQTDYAECKINTSKFEEGLRELGINCEEDIDFETAHAEDARYNFKLDPAKRKEK